MDPQSLDRHRVYRRCKECGGHLPPFDPRAIGDYPFCSEEHEEIFEKRRIQRLKKGLCGDCGIKAYTSKETWTCEDCAVTEADEWEQEEDSYV